MHTVKVKVNLVEVTVGVAMLVGVAMGLCGTCSDICNAPCKVAHLACQFIGDDGSGTGSSTGSDLCSVNQDACATACDAVCLCSDQCEAECTPPLDACLEAGAGNVIGLGACNVNFGVCFNLCQAECGVANVAGVISGASEIVGGVLDGAGLSLPALSLPGLALPGK